MGEPRPVKGFPQVPFRGNPLGACQHPAAAVACLPRATGCSAGASHEHISLPPSGTSWLHRSISPCSHWHSYLPWNAPRLLARRACLGAKESSLRASPKPRKKRTRNAFPCKNLLGALNLLLSLKASSFQLYLNFCLYFSIAMTGN